MSDFKPGDDPIIRLRLTVDPGHVVSATDRYENKQHGLREEPINVQGSKTTRPRAEVRKELVERINMDSYEVNAPAVAEAILLRLLAGSALTQRKP